jgi:hypothetical protein
MPLRLWLAILMLCGLAACAQMGGGQPGGPGGGRPGGGQTGGAAATPSVAKADAAANKGFRFFAPEFEGLVQDMGGKLVVACGGFGRSGARLENCMRDRFAAAFDDSGQGRSECQFHTVLTDYIGCVAIGNTFIDIRRRLADASPLPGGFWTGSGAMTDALVKSIVGRGLAACGDSGASQAVEDCVDSWFEKSLDLPAGMTARCPAPGAGSLREGCLAEATMVRYMQEHVARLDAVST